MRKTINYFIVLAALSLVMSCKSEGKSSQKTVADSATQAVSIATGPKLNIGDVIVFTKTAGYRHESIAAGVAMFDKLLTEAKINFVHTEDASIFNAANLNSAAAIVFLNTTGDVLNEEQQKIMYRMVESGTNFIGVHGAADTEHDWNWYGNLVGGYFKSHPNEPNVREAVCTKRGKHACTSHLPKEWKRADEWYNFDFLHDRLKPVLLLDESSYEGGENGSYHPITWLHRSGKGKMFYTGLGHTAETYEDENFVAMMKDVVKTYCRTDKY